MTICTNDSTAGEGGYYGWHGLRYFLYEYEVNLLSQSRQQKVTWDDLLKTPKDKILIEHIFPQPSTDSWKDVFSDVMEDDYCYHRGSIGNLLLLSMLINNSLQNDTFDEKKHPKIDDSGEKIRNGYSDGSYSEIEVSKFDEWNSVKIEERGLQLLNFMEKRRGIKFKDEEDKKSLLDFWTQKINLPMIDRVAKAQGCLLGQLAGDALGSLVEFQSPDEIRHSYPDGVRELADGGTWNTIAGQPTDDSETGLLLSRMLVKTGFYDPAAARKEYQYWLSSDPFDCGMTISAGCVAIQIPIVRPMEP